MPRKCKIWVHSLLRTLRLFYVLVTGDPFLSFLTILGKEIFKNSEMKGENVGLRAVPPFPIQCFSTMSQTKSIKSTMILSHIKKRMFIFFLICRGPSFRRLVYRVKKPIK